MNNQYPVSKCRSLLRTGLIVVTLLFSGIRIVSADEAPPFVEVGKSYSGGGIQFYVLEVGKAGWVKVVLRQTNQLGWINTNAMPVIVPYPALEVNAPPAAPWR